MDSKGINKLLIIVSVILGLTFLACLYFCLHTNSNFAETIGAISSFFVAVLTILYVYTTSKQIDLMKQQLDQMQHDQRSREQPVLDLESVEFEIERPKFFSSPDGYQFLARHFLSLKIKNVSSYPAAFVDISAQLAVEDNDTLFTLDTVSKTINIIPAKSFSDKVNIMFVGDSQGKIMTALRSTSTYKCPQVTIKVYYRSLSGENYALSHSFWLDLPEDALSDEILINWHTNLSSAPIEAQEAMEILSSSTGDKKYELFKATQNAFNSKLCGDKTLPLKVVESPRDFSLTTLSDKDYKAEIESHSYGRYIHSRSFTCPPKNSK